MQTFICTGDFQSASFDRLDAEADGAVIRHTIQGGGTLWETHGGRDGSYAGAEQITFSEGDWLLCCWPKRVQATHPALRVAASHVDAPVKAVYGYHSDETYTVTVR